MWLHKFAIIDDTLETLGTSKEYQRLRNWIIQIIIGLNVYVFCRLACVNIISFLILNNHINLTLLFILMTITFLKDYPSNVIILNALISAAILGLVLYLCIYFVSYFY